MAISHSFSVAGLKHTSDAPMSKTLHNFGSGMKCLGHLCRFSGGFSEFQLLQLCCLGFADSVDQERIELLKLELSILQCLACLAQ